MDAAEFRATQAPIKDRFKTDPKSAMITLTARGSIENEGIACIRQPEDPAWNSVPAICCSKRWSPAPA